MLIWLLALALPAQGATAAIMAFCNPNHHAAALHGAAAEPAPQRPLDEHPAHTAHAHSGHDTDGAEHPAHIQPAGKAPASAGSVPGAEVTKLAHADKHQCSACASCCSAAAVHNTVLSVPAPEVTPTVFIAVVATVERFTADGPDRPPRIILV